MIICAFNHFFRPFTQADWDLAEHVVSCWTNFAKTGDPGLGWKAYTPAAPDFMVFELSEDGAKDASAMGKPLPRRQSFRASAGVSTHAFLLY